jgi:hypothetical protein
LAGDSLNTLNQSIKNGIGSILILPDVMMQKAKFYAQRLFTNVPDNLTILKNSDAILLKQLLCWIFQQDIRVVKTIHCSFRKR